MSTLHILKEEIETVRILNESASVVPDDVIAQVEMDMRKKLGTSSVKLSDKKIHPSVGGSRFTSRNEIELYASVKATGPHSALIDGDYAIVAAFKKGLNYQWTVEVILEWMPEGEGRYGTGSVILYKTYKAKTKLNESTEVLEESKGHFVIVKTAVVANIDSTLKSVVSKWDGTVRQKKKDGSFMNHILSFKSKTDADRARQAIEDEEIELIRSVNYRDELV